MNSETICRTIRKASGWTVTSLKAALVILLLSVALAKAADETAQTPEGDTNAPAPPDYQDIKDNDKAMDQAVTKARESLGFFLAALQAKKTRHGRVRGEKMFHRWRQRRAHLDS